jgi:hypothetical protein
MNDFDARMRDARRGRVQYARCAHAIGGEFASASAVAAMARAHGGSADRLCDRRQSANNEC